MKKSLLALAALTAFAGAASAQSSVTLFGVVDLAARSVDNGDRLLSLSTDGNASSRLGFRGVEDLGGGLRAGFWIEGAMSADNGTASGQTWQRRSTVSLLGGFGELRLGRDYTPTFWNHTVFDPFGTNGVGSQTNLMTTQLQIPGGATAAQTAAANKDATILGSGAGTLVRANNTIGYFLPAMGGLYGQFMVAAGESPSGSSGNKYMGFRLGYGAGPLNAAFAYGKTSDLIIAPNVEAPDLKAFNLGASYNLGFMTAMAQYHSYKQGDLKQTNYLLGANVPMGPGTFKASYGKVDLDDGTDSAGASQIAVGYVYDLSKRTALYTHFAKVSNDSGLTFVTGGSTGPSIANTGEGSTGFEFGVRHSF